MCSCIELSLFIDTFIIIIIIIDCFLCYISYVVFIYTLFYSSSLPIFALFLISPTPPPLPHPIPTPVQRCRVHVTCRSILLSLPPSICSYSNFPHSTPTPPYPTPPPVQRYRVHATYRNQYSAAVYITAYIHCQTI